MTHPQLEDGYLRIANELYDAILAFPFSKRQLKVVLAVIRKTYGYGKKRDELSASQVAQMTGLPRQHVTATLQELVIIGVVLKQDGQYANSLSVNKNYSEWRDHRGVRASPETGHVPKQDRGCPETGQEVVLKQDTQKTTPKDNSKRGRAKRPSCPFDEIHERYNEAATRIGMPQCTKLTDNRKRLIRARWFEAGKPDGCMNEFFEAVEAQPFLGGQNDRGWQASIDWLFTASKFIKVQERQYVRTGGSRNEESQRDRKLSAVERARRANGLDANYQPDGGAVGPDDGDVRPPLAERIR